MWRKGPRRNAAAARLVERGSRFLDSAGQPREFPADVQTNLAGKIQEVADETPSSYQDFALTCKFVALGIDNAGKGLAPTCKSIDFVFWRAIHLHLTWDLSYTSVRVAVQSSLRALKAELESAPARGEPAIAPAVVLWTLGRAMLDGVIAEFTGEHPELATLHGPPDDPSATPVKLWLAEAQHVADDPGGAGILDPDDEFALRPGRWLTGSDRLIQPLCTYLQAQSALLPGISTTREIVEDFCRDALARLLEEWFCECMRLTFPLPGGLIAWQLQHETATRATGKLNEPAQVTNEINRRGH